MKKARSLAAVSLALCTVMFLFGVVDFLALHDIFHDYVSREALEGAGAALGASLPSWTDASLEWGALAISYYLRLALTVLNVGVLLFCLKALRPRTGQVGLE